MWKCKNPKSSLHEVLLQKFGRRDTINKEYIRGKRQGQALFFFIEGMLRRNLMYAKRELEILFGFAKPYKLCFAPTFKSSYVALFGEDAYNELKQKTGATELEDVASFGSKPQ